MKNVIEHLVIMSGQERVELDTVEEQIISSYEYSNLFERKMLHEITTERHNHDESRPGKRTLREQMEFHEAVVIRARLKEAATLKDAARSLGIDTSTLVRKKQSTTCKVIF
jgi:transcriptional regulator with PAS, ATPase and Fis domain